jgi:hypothetical protein
MKLLRKLIFLSLKYNILFKAVHIPGVKNKYSDALSRLQIQEFLALMPEADQSQWHFQSYHVKLFC